MNILLAILLLVLLVLVSEWILRNAQRQSNFSEDVWKQVHKNIHEVAEKYLLENEE